MRIDLHCHTKKCKQGDGNKRSVSKEKFTDKILNADVGVVAITNHNCFDIDQYNEFKNDEFLLWPGIELDVQGENSKGHCIIICNPNSVDDFDIAIKKMVGQVHPDQFIISIEDLAKCILDLDVLLICHYGSKNPALCEDDILSIKSLISEEVPFYCEPRNLISAGIYYGKNIKTMIGSDVKDWDNYPKDRVPELKMPIDSFDHFKLLIKKDAQVIQTFLDRKDSKEIEIIPFENKEEKFVFKIYNDINVIFGGKGSGKTKILEAIEEKLTSLYPNEISTYYASNKSKKYENIVDSELRDNDFDKLKISDCSEEFENLKMWKAKSIPTLNHYKKWKQAQKNKTSKFGFVNSTCIENVSDINYKKISSKYNKLTTSIDDIITNSEPKYLSDEKIKKLEDILNELRTAVLNDVKKENCEYHALYLERFTIKKMKNLYTAKKGTISKPVSSGLLELFEDASKIEKIIKTIDTSLLVQHHVENRLIGEIGTGDYIYSRKSIFLDGTKAVKSSKKISNLNIAKDFRKILNEMRNNCFSVEVDASIAKLVSFMEYNNIYSLRKLMFANIETIKTKNRILTNDSDKYSNYTPSNGEQAMLIISHAINVEKKVYILDEPEMSVGHDYINQKILNRIKELASNNCIVIVATHDANIAVRSLPLQSIYREKIGNITNTYTGNPFVENMININDDTDIKSWTKLSLNTLEGGKDAFIERGETYGSEL